MKPILALLFLLAVSSCGGKAPMDEYCSSKCGEEYGEKTDGLWMGNDSFWQATRCRCLLPGGGAVDRMFPLRVPERR